MKTPRAIQNLIDSFERLPGIGPKTAERLTFYLLHVPQTELDRFAASLVNLKQNTVVCSRCFSVDDVDPCSLCRDERRDQSVVCVVEQPLDVLALEKSGKYRGSYHVLHGKIDPLNNIGPDEIRINELIRRLRKGIASNVIEEDSSDDAMSASNAAEANVAIKEIILATNPTMEGEATAMYISKQLKSQNSDLKITRIGRGLPIGADLEYADPTTLDRAMEGRSEY